MKVYHLAVLAIAALVSGAPGAAQDALPRAAIKTGDLDLSSPAGRATFDRRLRSSAEMQCGRGNSELGSQVDASTCRKTMIANGRTQMATLEAQREAAARAKAEASVRAQARMAAARRHAHARYASSRTSHRRARGHVVRHRVHHWHRPAHRSATTPATPG